MTGVKLRRCAHHDSSSGVTLWPISGQQAVYVTEKYQISSLGPSTEVRLKKYQVPGTRYHILAMEMQKKAGQVTAS